MLFSMSRKDVRLKSFNKNLISTSALSAISTVAFMAVATSASAQMAPVIVVDECSEFMDNPLTDAGGTVQVFLGNEAGQVCNVDGAAVLSLDNGQDNVTVNIASNVRLNSLGSDDEDVVIFIDNAENNNRVNVGADAVLTGLNGVIYFEGDGATLVNNGRLIGTGAQEQGVVYFDRDTDNDLNTVINGTTGEIIAQDNGPAIGIEVLIPDNANNADAVGVQSPLADFPTFRIVNRAGGLIQTTGSESDDNDAINIAGNPGTSSGVARSCIEGAAVNCQFNLSLTNFGTIRSIFENGSVAGITVEDDAVFNGLIINGDTGLITGTSNGIRIGDIVVDGATAEHTGRITNFGTISGTGTSSRGIDLEGDGVTVVNQAGGTISGLSTGIAVGAGETNDVANSGVNNFILNRGTISGENASINSSEAAGAVRILSIGGTFTGNIIGSDGNADFLGIRGGVTNLTHDVLGGFEVRTLPGGELNFVGDRTIGGNLINGGVIRTDVSNTQTVTGDVRLRVGSSVAITDTTGVAAVGDQFTLINVGGSLVNNGSLDTTDSSLLVDFNVVEAGNLVVEAVAAGAGSAKAIASTVNFSSATNAAFGETVLNAFVDGGLNGTAAFTNLISHSDGSSVGAVLESLAPDFSGQLTQNIFSATQNSAAQIDQRLNDLECNYFYGAPETASFDSSAAQGCESFAETGAWVQVNGNNSSEGNLSFSAPAYLNSESDKVTMTYGYDHAVNDETVIGFSGSYTRTEANQQRQAFDASSTDLDVLQFAAYAGRSFGNVDLVTKAAFTKGDAETRRQSFEVIQSDVEFYGLNVSSVASYDVDLGKGFYLKPEAGFLYDNVTTSAFSEAGGLNLNVGSTSTNVLDARAGLTLGARRHVTDALKADVYVTGAVVDDLYGQRAEIDYNFGGQAGSFGSRSLDNFGVQALMGVNLLSSDKFSFGAAVNTEFSETQTAVGSSVRTSVRW